ncbi:hypothetical protein POM88_008466 [Heracleum sosnowskyi]|uniref:GIR1-like zinc ribbon domain-containing protein n=1 Tax=Heracleum sosnowskyi TaxID=360622 RepID=A0AAD8J787_9APIA|nr:hypothetical protein POM88_008466 [Heracleum sosnowskyi]
MAIWRKKKQRTEEEGLIEEKKSSSNQSSKSNSCLTHSHKDANEGNEEEVSLKAPKIPDLNEPYKEEESSGEVIVLPSKRSNKSCMIKTPEATTKMHKYQTYIPPKLIVKGCQACYMFVMVPETDDRCPKCRVGTYLFDVCHEFHANKKRLI